MGVLTVDHVVTDNLLFVDIELAYGNDRFARAQIRLPSEADRELKEGLKRVLQEFAEALSRAVPKLVIRHPT